MRKIKRPTMAPAINTAKEIERIKAWQKQQENPPDSPDENSVLMEAYNTTRRSRQNEYGHPIANFWRFGVFLTDFLRMEGVLRSDAWINPRQVAWIMVLTKVARDIETDKRDNWVDTAGYADCLGRMDEWMRSRGCEDGIAAFRTMTEAECRKLFEE